ALHLRRGIPADRGDEEGGLSRSEEIPARAAEDQLRRRHRPDRLRRKGRPQGCRDDDLHHEGRQDRADRRDQERQDGELRGGREDDGQVGETPRLLKTAPRGAVFIFGLGLPAVDTFLQQVINGLTAGSVYAVVALGYT